VLGGGFAGLLPTPVLDDWTVVLRAGHQLIRGDFGVYIDDPRLNVGPLALLLVGVLGHRTLAAAAGAALLPLMVALTRRVSTHRTAAVLLAAGLPWCVAGAYGHLDDQLAAALLVVAVAVGNDRARGFASAVAVLAKPWAVFILAAQSWRASVWTATAIALAATPFVVVGGLAGAGRFMVDVQDGSTLSLFVDDVPDWWRVAQLLAMAAVAGWLRRDPLVACTAAVCVRLLLDPGDFPYYAAALAGLSACLAARGDTAVPLAASWPLSLAAALPAEPLVRTAALAIALGACIRAARGPSPRFVAKVFSGGSDDNLAPT
jgi:hypothetical protein